MEQQLEQLQFQLSNIQVQLQQKPFGGGLTEEVKKLLDIFKKLLATKVKILRQKPKQTWIKASDSNTNSFPC